MSEHAGPLSTRIGLLAFATVMAAGFFNGVVDTAFVLASIFVGIAVYAVSYAAVYLAESWVVNRRMVLGINGRVAGNNPEPEKRDRVVTISPSVSALLPRLAKVVLKDNIEIISKRSLDEHGVVTRYASASDELMQFLIAGKMIYLVGNHQYRYDDRLKTFLQKYYKESE